MLSGEELHYRKRHRQMKVALMDGQEKLVLVDESAPVSDVCAEICEKLRLEKPYEEWSLTLGSTRAFLDPVLGLQEQNVTEKDKGLSGLFSPVCLSARQVLTQSLSLAQEEALLD